MNDEIKEILNGLNVVIKHGGSVEINSKECKKIIDYITNLQEENQRLKEELKNRPIVDFTFDTYKELEDYKSRCKKAIEFNQIILDSDYVYSQDEIAQKNLNILQGGDEE